MDGVDAQVKLRILALGLGVIVACGGASDDEAGPPPGGSPDAAVLPPDLPYATSVFAYEPGPGAGFGQDRMPDIVLGPPMGFGPNAGSLDVVSLGVGGTIVLAFAEPGIVDGPGPDFVVFENAFWIGGDPQDVFAELAEVSVSDDGDSWSTFACDPAAGVDGRWPGCAGWRPTLMYDPVAVQPLDPAETGGDPFDLADLGLSGARFVRVRDLATEGDEPTAGFDLDAVGIVERE